MWLICFKPNGSNSYTPQIICSNEQEAKHMVQNMPYSVVGSYFYMFVPMASPVGVFKREEPYQLPAYQPALPYYVEDDKSTAGRRRQWQIEIGDWPGQPPLILN